MTEPSDISYSNCPKCGQDCIPGQALCQKCGSGVRLLIEPSAFASLLRKATDPDWDTKRHPAQRFERHAVTLALDVRRLQQQLAELEARLAYKPYLTGAVEEVLNG